MQGTRRAAIGITVGLAAAASALGGAGAAVADSAPTHPEDPATPLTVTADALPTVQIDGVGLTQVVIGTTVYVGGKFSTARPPGAAAGVDTVPRSNILAYDLLTGDLVNGFHPRFNGTVHFLTTSPDRRRLYVGGAFTRLGGRTANRFVALDPTTGRRVAAFRSGADKDVRAIVAAGRSVWIGGSFSAVRGKARAGLARVRASDGRVAAWAPRATGGAVTELAISPDRTVVAAGGRFTKVNGSSRPGYGLARLNAATGRLLAFPLNNLIRDGGRLAGITSLVSRGGYLYGSGFAYTTKDGNFEGVFKSRWSDGRLVWLASCHGDTYSVFPAGQAVYAVGHAHNCRNLGAFRDTSPKTYYKGIAFSDAVTGTNAPEPPGSQYFDFSGRPAPSLLTWFPAFDNGTTTTSQQGPWSVTGRGSYLAVAGEFLHVNRVAQQGLVRFALPDVDGVPNAQGPRPTTAGLTPTATVTPDGVTVRWPTAWDRDNARLTYELLRSGGQPRQFDPITTESSFWAPVELSVDDTEVETGTTYTYRVRVTDPFSNRRLSDPVQVDVP